MSDAGALQLPLGFEHWAPALQAITFGLMTFVQEDVPTISAALLAAAGQLGWQTGFWGCFLGIWIGDALLYAIARAWGRPLMKHRFFEKWIGLEAIRKSELWFVRQGGWLVFTSRFLPGTRLPTYLAAGFLRLPFGTFLALTALAVGIWTLLIFGLARFLGAELAAKAPDWGRYLWMIVLGLWCLLLTARHARVIGKAFWQLVQTAFERSRRWEFWPAGLFYAPVTLNYLWLAVRYRGLTLPTAANPGIFSGGFVGESKLQILRELSAAFPQFTAEAHEVTGLTPAQRIESFERLRAQHGFEFPLILKPDVGQRGIGVKLIRNYAQAVAYLQQTGAPLILQRYVAGPQEAGIFYYRIPGESQGRIFAITEKIFPEITGDGSRTLEQLIADDPRARLMAGTYLERFRPQRRHVLAPGEKLRLVQAGNHAQGCIFRDGAHLGSDALERQIDAIAQALNGFFIGRFDIRFASEDDLRAGKNFQIIELNGASSEATNIYDARNSLLSAYRTLFRQWRLVFAIGAIHRAHGVAPMGLGNLWKAWRRTVHLARTYPVAD
jgi:membrane protein DedA with SNARE-associated domain